MSVASFRETRPAMLVFMVETSWMSVSGDTYGGSCYLQYI